MTLIHLIQICSTELHMPNFYDMQHAILVFKSTIWLLTSSVSASNARCIRKIWMLHSATEHIYNNIFTHKTKIYN